MDTKVKQQKRDRRKKRIRAKVFGTEARPRLSVFKSNKYIYAQIINDDKGHTLVEISTKNIKGKTLTDKALIAGKELAAKALTKKIDEVVFDRGGYIYTGVVKGLADGAREAGLKF